MSRYIFSLLLPLLIWFCDISNAQEISGPITSDSTDLYCHEVKLLAVSAYYHFMPILKTRYRRGQNLYECIIHIPGLNNNQVIIDSSRQLFYFSAENFYSRFEDAKNALQHLRISMRPCFEKVNALEVKLSDSNFVWTFMSKSFDELKEKQVKAELVIDKSKIGHTNELDKNAIGNWRLMFYMHVD